MGHDHIAHLQSNPKISIRIICDPSRIVPWVEWSFPCRGSIHPLKLRQWVTQLRVHFQQNLNIIFEAWQQSKQTLQRGAKFLTRSLDAPDFSIEQILCLVVLLSDEAASIHSRNPNFVAPIVVVSGTVSERVVSPSTGQLQRSAPGPKPIQSHTVPPSELDNRPCCTCILHLQLQSNTKVHLVACPARGRGGYHSTWMLP